MPKPELRFLTEKEITHARRLLWRTTLVGLGAKLGISYSHIGGAINPNPARTQKLRISVIKRLTALSVDDFEKIRIRQ